MDQTALSLSPDDPYDPSDPTNAFRLHVKKIIDDHLTNHTLLTDEDVQKLSRPIKQWRFRPGYLNSLTKDKRKLARLSGKGELDSKRRDILRKMGMLRPRPKISPFSQEVFNDKTLYRGRTREFRIHKFL